MAPPQRNFGDHDVEWSDTENKVVIRPRYPNATITKHFGLGNALITLNLSNLPQKIVVPITGETTKKGIAPTSPFGLKRWFGAPSDMTEVSKTVTGFDGWTETVRFQQATGGSVKEVSSVEVVQNGFGSTEINGSAQRLNW